MKIGHGKEKNDTGYDWPYNVYINLENDELPIGLSEGFGYGTAGANFKLSALLKDQWKDHLSICRCQKLIDIAKEEKSKKVIFTANEIYEKWKSKEQGNGAEL